MRWTPGLVVIAASLPGCQSEEQFRQRWRETAVGACIDEARARELPQGVDAARLCNCSIDRMMAGKSVAELRSYRPNPADTQAAAQCAAEAIVPPQQRSG